ncbi:LPXTG cell wall anchor domain-containing protein [Arthrobacter sp. MMS18-M83]|uniref:LPXTG cell wall anchor domain-containing protein n=1 Tax=Arthrobacter sp. MMS18-M83 TaxID=2996261 RepID=UPI00227B8EDB|nr:LPXTG cell wall anchor domain-containing protein [Arthrobacter sp. MMS18-M83]WAH95901.1 LPXTG cell wall anchor domain-containing protein [Arthrobacter sp. MMS18-M83]
MKKSLAVLALAGTIALAASAPAMAVDYPAPAQQGTVSNATVGVGGTVVFSGNGFAAGETVNITVNQTTTAQGAAAPGTGSVTMAVAGALPLAPLTLTAVANSAGAYSVTVQLNSAGTYVLTAVGATSGHTVTATVVASSASTAGLANTGGAGLANTGAGLANTGVDSSLILWGLVGAGALVAGTASVVVVRRRAKGEAVAAA